MKIFIPNYVCMSIWQVQIHQSVTGDGACSQYVKAKNQWNLQNLQTAFGIADDIFIVGYNVDDRYHDRTLNQVVQMCHWENVN